ncbi:uncharacterized protein LOC105445758 [Strongylocentrotus purpuratus]|uniref:Netrin receptor UNC5 n=1 Tax=Strongylocentrotus purpuratus TaxID=7668 RepID=A0A7M7NNW1_STRPU|nr:uncharacterized protein LOC105445758 [Strongylocentrotus purpuratus]
MTSFIFGHRTSDMTPTGNISDQDLLTLARRIKSKDFMGIGTKLGFSRNKLENIKHKTLQNRKDANIQMLCAWKASQRSDPEATETLKCIWESVSLASTAANTDDSLQAPSSATPEMRAKPNEPIEPEDMDIITTSDTERDGINDDLNRCEGTPNTEELCSVALSVKSLPLAFSLGKALRVNDDLIVEFIDLPSSSVLHKIARQLVENWLNGLKEAEQEDKFAKLLSEYNIPDVNTGREEISKAIGSKKELVDLCYRLNVKPSGVLQIMSTFVTFPPDMIGRCTLKMLKEWVHHGGTRERLLEVAQAFRFNDAAVKIAEAMKCQPNYTPFISHGIIDHKGGELTLNELGIAVSIPEGAMPKGMRSVVTLRVPTHGTPRLPVREGEVVITPAIVCSLTQELLKPATVVLPLCTNHHELTDDSSVILYTRTGPGKFGRRNLTPRTSEILKDKIKFHTRHLQVWALASTDLQGLQLKCVVFQPLSMTPAEKPTLRVYIIHPYRNVIEDITRKEKSSSVPYCKVRNEVRFSIQSTSMDLTILLHDGAKINKRMVNMCESYPIRSVRE